MQKECLYCNEKLKGRSDKKFCDDSCRNAYNNQLNSDTTQLMRHINYALRKNRRILLQLNPTGKTTVHKSKMDILGFSFSYHTSITTTKAGATYFFCYEQGYLPLEKDFYLLVAREEN